MAANNNSSRMTINNAATQNKPANQVRIQPDGRQLIADISPTTLMGIVMIFLMEWLPRSNYVMIAQAAVCICVIVSATIRYTVLMNYSWEISDVKICRRHGVLTRQTDYIELYRVVDYRETQSFLQRILGIKSVVIISTDKSDPNMLILGVPTKMNLVDYTRNLVEQNKKENHIYEITNR